MVEKDTKNFVAKVVAQNKDGKDVVQMFRLSMEDNTVSYEELKEIKPLDWDIAKKEYSVVGFIY